MVVRWPRDTWRLDLSGYTGQHRLHHHRASAAERAWMPTRRVVLGGAAAGTATLIIGGIADPAHALTLASHSEIYNQRTFYQNLSTGGISPASFRYDPMFYSRLETWFAFWRKNTPDHWTAPHRISLNGVYVAKPGWHGQGRAMDVSRIDFTNTRLGGYSVGFDGRHNVWRSRTGSSLVTTRRLYWGTVASLNYHFAYVLHYNYNAEHDNHVHADNGVSGSGNSRFTSGSSTQNKFVQSTLNYIWGYSTSIDGRWGPQTDSNSRKALARAGVSGSLTSQANWLAFCRASFRLAVGKQSY